MIRLLLASFAAAVATRLMIPACAGPAAASAGPPPTAEPTTGNASSLHLLPLPGGGGEATTLAIDSFPLPDESELHNEALLTAREMRLRAIKTHILDSLGLRALPNVTTESSDPWELPPISKLLRYNPGMQADGTHPAGSSDGTVKFKKMFSFPKPAVDPELSELGVIHFQAHAAADRPVRRADLWIGLDQSYSPPGYVVLYTARRRGSRSSPNHKYFLHKEIVKEIRANTSHWAVLDVKSLVTESMRDTDDPGTLNLAIHTYDSRGDVIPFVNDSKALFLELGLEGGPKRPKRSLGLTCDENSREVRCCRYPLTVDFEEFGWDWIIAPKRYEANYCSGECPYVFLQKYPHTHLVQQASPLGSAGPCCAPRKMSAISMLYFDEDHNIMYGMLPEMIVDHCGCA